MIRAITELLLLLRWLISTHKAERFRDDVEDIKQNPSDSWSKRFGRLQPGAADGIDNDARFNDNTEGMPACNSDITGRR